MASSVFHPGELQFQHLAGTRGVADELGGGLKSELEPSVSSLFYNLRFAWLSILSPGTTCDNSPHDDRSRIWVFLLLGTPGFVQIHNSTLFSIRLDSAMSKDGLLYQNITSMMNTPVSFLAIDFEARRRYRTNGFIESFDRRASALYVKVSEAFGNCPKYIQKRVLTPETESLNPTLRTSVSQSRQLSNSDINTITSSDTFFLGTYYKPTGMDINHRGGQPGFVRVVSSTEIYWPEYRGNGMFQSSGNLQENNRAGATFLDFLTGDVLQLTGRAVVDWDFRDKVNIEAACQRVMRFFIDGVRRSNGPVTDYRWKVTEYSPYNPDLPNSISPDNGDRLFPMVTRLVKIVEESDNVKTFRFLAPKPVNFLPGQYATFEFNDLDVQRYEGPIVRTWTLSEVANSTDGDVTLEISVRRVPEGQMSNWLHTHAKLGLKVKLLGIGGEMTPFKEGFKLPAKLLLISGGIGITPNMAILRGIGARVDARSNEVPSVVIIHQEKRLNDMPFRKELVRRSKSSAGKIKLAVFLSREATCRLKREFNCTLGEGRISSDDLQELAGDAKERIIYLCGPISFMNSITESLLSLGVNGENIITEKFDF